MNFPIRVGFGFDVHQLKDDHDFWLGGIKIPHTKGAIGHSDADVLIHAICDALLGAVAMGDIGTHFPNTSSVYKGIDSKKLLGKTIKIIGKEGWEPVNIDATVCLEKPKIVTFVPAMKRSLARVSGIDPDSISIKATTMETLGFVGQEKGVTAHAVALVTRNKK